MSLLIFLIIISVILLPLMGVIATGILQDSDIFLFLLNNILSVYISNSMILVLFVVIGTFIIGVGCAWLVSRYDFWGHKFWEWALFLPIALPAYITAYAYTDFLDLHFSNVRTLGSAAFVLILCLYPYVYLFARLAFSRQPQSQIDSAQLLGAGSWKQFLNISLPAARPFILVGLSLVIMETLADYGTVSYFGVKVFSTGIYNAWTAYGDIVAAARLSIILLLFISVIFFIERQSRRKMRFYDLANSEKTNISKSKQSFKCALFSIIACSLPIILGFLLPVLILFEMVVEEAKAKSIFYMVIDIYPYARNTIFMAVIVSILGVSLAYILANIKRDSSNKFIGRLYQICGFGYALPGVVLGLGLLIISGFIQNNLGLFISGSFFFLIFGYLIRFFVIPLQGLDAAYEKISPNIDNATALIRNSKMSEFWHIRLPLLLPAILSAFLLLLVDVIKELPLTLMLRPFDFDTLAIRAYHLASDERLTQAAFPSLIIALTGVIPVLILARLIKRA